MSVTSKLKYLGQNECYLLLGTLNILKTPRSIPVGYPFIKSTFKNEMFMNESLYTMNVLLFDDKLTLHI